MTDSTGTRPTRHFHVYDALTIFLTLATVAAAIYAPYRIDHDAAWYIHLARLSLQDRASYLAVMEVNRLEVSTYLSGIPYLVTQGTGIDIKITFALGMLALSVYGAWMSRHVLGRHTFHGQNLAIVSVLPFMVTLLTLHYKLTRAYAEREHMFVVMLLPGLLLRYARWRGAQPARWLAILIGIVAALGTLIKPPFALIVLLPELYWLAIHRRVRPLFAPEVIAFAVTGILYVLHPFFVFPADALRIYSTIWANYGNYYLYWEPMTWGEILFSTNVLIGVAASVLGVALAYISTDETQRRLTIGLAMAIAGSVIVYTIQRRGFSYHFMPAIYFICVTMALVLVYISHRFFTTRWMQQAAIHIPVLAAATILYLDLSHFFREHQALQSMTPELHQLLQDDTETGDEMIYMGMNFLRYTDITVSGLWHVHNYGSLDPLRYQLGRTQADTRPVPVDEIVDAELNRYFDDLAAEINTRQPHVLLVASGPGCNQHCDASGHTMLGLLQQNPEIQRILGEDYIATGTADNHTVFQRSDVSEGS
ncbi:MAG: hypothetical protein AAFU54_10355 [Chloroflexota bacterium]